MQFYKLTSSPSLYQLPNNTYSLCSAQVVSAETVEERCTFSLSIFEIGYVLNTCHLSLRLLGLVDRV